MYHARTFVVLLVGVVAITLTSSTPTYAQKPKELLPAEAVWTRYVDEKADGILKKNKDEGYDVKFSVTMNQISGTWTNKADAKIWKISGEIIAGKTPLVILKEVGGGSVTVYTGKLVAPGRIVGTCYTNDGSSGDFEFILEKK